MNSVRIRALIDLVWDKISYSSGLVYLNKEDNGDMNIAFSGTAWDNGHLFIFLRNTWTEMTPEFGLLVRRFVKTLFVKNDFDIDITGIYEDYFDGMYDEDDEDSREIREYIKSYYAGIDDAGIWRKEFLDNNITPLLTSKELKAYVPTEKEAPIYEVMIDGVECIYGDKTLASYKEAAEDEEHLEYDRCGGPMFEYTEDDPIAHEIIESLNSGLDCGIVLNFLVTNGFVVKEGCDMNSDFDDYPVTCISLIRKLDEMIYKYKK